MDRERLLTIVEIGLAVALAAALNMFKLFEMPQGGSVALDMAPIMLIALRRGWRTGMLTGFLYGWVNMLPKPFVVHPAQLVLDYPLAFTLVGLSGLFGARWRKLVDEGGNRNMVLAQWTALLPGTLVGAAARGLSHIASGWVFFASYAPEGQHPVLYSIIYNSAYLIPSAAIAAVVLWVTMPTLELAVPFRARAGRA